jgi:hypothetical protein
VEQFIEVGCDGVETRLAGWVERIRDVRTPLGLSLAATEGRSACHLSGRKDWTSAASGASVSPRQ